MAPPPPTAAAPPGDALVPALEPALEVQAEAAAAAPRSAGPKLAGKSRAPWSEVVMLASLSMFGSVAMDMYLPALPGMAQALRASPRDAQATISVFLLGLAFGQLVFGPLSDRVGRRPPILAGVVMFLLASGACAVSTGVGALIAARLVQALGACAGMVVSRAVVRDRYDDHEVLHVFSLLSLVFGVAPIVAPLVGGWVLAVSGWRSIFGWQAAFGVLAGLAAWFRLPESRSERTRDQARAERPWSSYAALLHQPLLTGYLLTGALSGAALFSYITAAPQVVMNQFHIPAAHFGWVFGANSAGWIGASQLNARLARRVSGERLLQGALLVALAASLLLLASAWTRWGGVWGVLVPPVRGDLLHGLQPAQRLGGGHVGGPPPGGGDRRPAGRLLLRRGKPGGGGRRPGARNAGPVHGDGDHGLAPALAPGLPRARAARGATAGRAIRPGARRGGGLAWRRACRRSRPADEIPPPQPRRPGAGAGGRSPARRRDGRPGAFGAGPGGPR